MKKKETTLTQQTQYNGKIINIRLDQVEVNNTTRIREVVEHPGGVCVLAINQKDEVVVVEQYRYGISQFLLELPAGKKETNEDPLITAQRELSEEAGIEADTWESLGVFYPSPAYLNEVIHLYIASGLHTTQQNLDEGEYLDTCFLPLETLKQKILSNEITDGKTIALILRYSLLKEQKKD
jgi:ADP-ribose pyrophosphatase